MKKKGFTLIELLAVIVILAIVALITIPLVLGVIDRVQIASYKESLRSLFTATDLYIASRNFVDFPEEGINIMDADIEVKNKNFTSGKIFENEDGVLELDKVSNGKYCAGGTYDNIVIVTGSCDALDITPPTITIASNLVTSSSITIVANAEDLESGINGYQFSKDNGETWTNKQMSNVYKFENLTNNTNYTFKVRVYNNNELSTISDGMTIATNDLILPTYIISSTDWTDSVVVTINFPERQTGYIYEYSLDNAVTWQLLESPLTKVDIPFVQNGNIISKISDGVNEVVGTTYSVTNIDTGVPGGYVVPSSIVSVNQDINLTLYGNNNLIPDGSFEMGIKYNPYSMVSRGITEIVSSESYDGNYSLRHESTANDSYLYYYTSSKAVLSEVNGGEKIKLTVWAKAEQENVAGQLYLFYLDENYNYTTYGLTSKVISIGTEWQQYELVGTVPAGALYLSARLDNDTPGSVVYWDSWNVYEDTGMSNIKRVQKPDGTWVNGSTTNYTVTDNGVYSFVVEDEAGNQNTISYEVTNIDRTLAAAPSISDGMIPITWNGTKWVKANTMKEWYNYNNQQWANMALVTSSSRNTYKNANPGVEVEENDILAYFVWIPRYKYQLFNVESSLIPVQKINIAFENNSAEKSTGTTNGQWLTHPAFTFDGKELNGLWVGKFETTGDAVTPTIKPNIRSLTNQDMSAQFTTVKLFSTSTYGGSISLDSHMIKNTEWGAIAYLSQSDYGKYGNPIYTGVAGLEKEIYINNVNSDINTGNGPGVTGCAGDTVNAAMIRSVTCPTLNQYHTSQGVKASTTGNIYGIYDMNGGSWEKSMSVMYNPDTITLNVSNSGFEQVVIDSSNMNKYLNKYTYGETYNDQEAYDRRILGDATGEIRGWNGDEASFVGSASSWFTRSGNYNNGEGAGIFLFNRGNGAAYTYTTFRTVISVE